jgi:hypothetical protein
MSTKAMRARALILAVLGTWVAPAAAQTPGVTAQPETLPTPITPAPQTPISNIIPPPSQAPAAAAGLPPGSVPDPWITYDRPGCCGPLGADGPIGWEFYTRNGVSIPTGNNVLQESINPGWQTAAGARTLLFNRATTAAWTADVGLSYTYNNAGRPDRVFNVLFPFTVTDFTDIFNPVQRLVFTPVPVTIRDYQRASLNMAWGFERYIGNPAYCPGNHFRLGGDIGGRWGASRLELNDVSRPDRIDFRRLYDVYGALFLSAHSDVELPINACTWFVAGVRTEWNVNWSDILKNAVPHQGSNLIDVNILLTAGLRY